MGQTTKNKEVANLDTIKNTCFQDSVCIENMEMLHPNRKLSLLYILYVMAVDVLEARVKTEKTTNTFTLAFSVGWDSGFKLMDRIPF